MEPIGIAIAGCGYWGPNLARNIDRVPGARVVAFADPSPGRRDRMMAQCPAARPCGDLAELIDDPKVGAVAIATPASQHYLQARAALEAGRHVLVEKPMALASDECDELIRIAESAGLTLMVDHTYLFSEPIRLVRRYVESGELGELVCASFQRLSLGIVQPDVNVAWDLAPHDLSILLTLAGEDPLRVSCRGLVRQDSGHHEVTNMTLDFPSGLFATIQNSWLEPRKVRQFTLVGTRKMLVYDDLEPLEKIRLHDSGAGRPPLYDGFDEFGPAYHYGDCHIPRIEQREPLRDVCESFVDCVRNGSGPTSDGRLGRRVVRVLEGAQASLGQQGAALAITSGA